MEYIVVDVQGFKDRNNNFLVKEICILSKNLKLHEIIKAPYSFNSLTTEEKQQIKWLEKNYHGLSWFDGRIDENEMKSMIEPIFRGRIVLVKGAEKVAWIKNMFTSSVIVLNLEDIGCNIQLHKKAATNSNNIYHEAENYCKRHKRITNSKNVHCAAKNAWLLNRWFKNSIFMRSK